MDYCHSLNPMLQCLINRTRQGPKCNQLFQGQNLCAGVAALSFPSLHSHNCIVGGTGKKQARLASVSSSQIKGSFSNKWQVWWAARLLVYHCCKCTAPAKEHRYYVLGKMWCSLIFLLGKSPYKLHKRETVEGKEPWKQNRSVTGKYLKDRHLAETLNGLQASIRVYFFLLLLIGLELSQSDFCFLLHPIHSFWEDILEDRNQRERKIRSRLFPFLPEPGKM